MKLVALAALSVPFIAGRTLALAEWWVGHSLTMAAVFLTYLAVVGGLFAWAYRGRWGGLVLGTLVVLLLAVGPTGTLWGEASQYFGRLAEPLGSYVVRVFSAAVPSEWVTRVTYGLMLLAFTIGFTLVRPRVHSHRPAQWKLPRY